MKLGSQRRIFEQDYAPEDKDLIKKLGIPLNASLEEIYNALNNKLTFRDNISATIGEFIVSVDANGVPKNNTQLKLENGQTTVEGLIVINAVGSTDTTLLPSGGIFVSFVRNNNFIVIQNIKGLIPNNSYKIKVVVLG